MKKGSAKYFLLAIAGSVIIGAGIFMLVSNYFEKVEVVVAKGEIEEGKVLEDNDLEVSLYYKESLPGGYISDKKHAIGKKILEKRHSGDPVTTLVFEEHKEKSLVGSLKEGEVLLGLNMEKDEPLVREISAGDKVCIVSDHQEQEYQNLNLHNSKNNIYADNYSAETAGGAGALIEYPKFLFDYEIYSLSENIFVADGQLIVKNLEVVDIYRSENKNGLSISSGGDESINLFIKCGFKDTPVISRIIKDNNYKIFLEKSYIEK